MSSVSVCLLMFVEVFKTLKEEEKNSLIERVYDALDEVSPGLDMQKRKYLEEKFRTMAYELSLLMEKNKITLSQALPLLAEKYPEFINFDRFKFDININ